MSRVMFDGLPKKNKGITAERFRRKWQNGVVDYLYWRAQQVQDRVEWEDLTIALKIVSNCYKGLDSPVESSYCWVFGIHQEKFLQDRREKEWKAAEMLVGQHKDEYGIWVTDEKPAVHREAPSTGVVYEMPQPSVSTEQKPVQPVPRKAKEAVSGI